MICTSKICGLIFNFEIHHILFTVDFLRGEWEKYGEVFVELEPFINSSEGYIKVTDNDMNEIRNYIIRMINEYYEAAPGYESALLGHMLSVMPVIFRRRNLNNERIFSKNTLVDEAIRQIKNTIYKNPKPSDIAERHYVTIDHLGRVWQDFQIQMVRQEHRLSGFPLLFGFSLKVVEI